MEIPSKITKFAEYQPVKQQTRMKRLLLIYIFIGFAINNIFAQTIILDESSEAGTIVTTSALPVYHEANENGKISLGIAYNKAMQTFFSLNLHIDNSQEIIVKKGNVIQLIAQSGEVFVLYNTETSLSESNHITISYAVQYNEKELADLDRIMNERIIKVRIETADDIFERNIENNSFSRAVYNCFSVLKNHLEKKRL